MSKMKKALCLWWQLSFWVNKGTEDKRRQGSGWHDGNSIRKTRCGMPCYPANSEEENRWWLTA
ncbi:MAG: hypothetical protein B6D35_15505 [Candidatus Brocadia sp. UTAMX2]|jgi:hypothetical protein|nr:MAG: hypothetical protein B6D35_15505 [Candidatus Brocadia sp. UTAMX2]